MRKFIKKIVRSNITRKFSLGRDIVESVFNIELSKLPDIANQNDIVNFSKSALDGVLRLPKVNESLNISDNDWQLKKITTSKNTALLWHQSLYHVTCLCKYSIQTNDIRYLNKAVEVFMSWFTWSLGNYKLAFGYTSLMDHAVSNRAISICWLNNAIVKLNFNISDEIKRTIIESLLLHVEWLCNDKYYFKNNHGVMSDRAILLISAKFRAYYNTSLWENKALQRLKYMLLKTFDKDGVCTENSPGYHIFNVRLYEKIVELIKIYEFKNCKVEEFEEIISKAKKASEFMIREDGFTSNVGDSEVTYYKDVPNTYGVVCYEESGFAIIKQKNQYLSLKCGGRSLSHKHLDETSITFRYAGKDIIVDGGNFNYDANDIRRQNSLSYLSHSGFFSKDFDKMVPRNFSVRDFVNKTSLKLIDNNEKKITFRAINNLLDDVNIIRDVSFIYPNKLIIVDEGSSSCCKVWIQKFMLHPKTIIVSREESLVRCCIEGIYFTIRQHCVTDYEIVVNQALYVEKFMSGENCLSIDFIASSKIVELRTVITVEN